MKKNIIAFDCGFSSYRVICGIYDGHSIKTEVITQIPNYTVTTGSCNYWDILKIYRDLLEGLKEAEKRNGTPDSLGISTWGVDFGLMDRNGFLIQNPLTYRNSIAEEYLKTLDGKTREELYQKTGIFCDQINSLFKICGMQEKMPAILSITDKFLMIPDLLNYFLTGVMQNDPSSLSTTQLMNAGTRTVSPEVCRKMNIPETWFPPLGKHGSRIGNILPEIRNHCGFKKDIPVICVPSHDTAAAVFGIPAKEDEYLFISSGTWSLIGLVTDTPVISNTAMKASLNNEIAAFNKITLIRNSNGMFILQRLKKEYEEENAPVSWEEFSALSDRAGKDCSVFDVNNAALFNPDSMTAEVKRLLSESGAERQSLHWPEIIRSFFLSMACNYAVTIESIEKISGIHRDTVYIGGGGARNTRLCQLIADIVKKKVVTCSSESTSLGNIASQILYFEPEKSLADIRDILRCSIEQHEYSGKTCESGLLGKYKKLIQK